MMKLERAREKGKKFLAPVPTRLGNLSVMFKALPLLLSNREEKFPLVQPGPFRTCPAAYRDEPRNGLRVTWFGHSSVLVEQDGVRLLVDPVWDLRAGPLRWAGPKRFFPPTIELKDLPELDAVVLSHDHYDHLGKETVKLLASQRPELCWIVPLRVGRLLRKLGVGRSRIKELDWTESVEVINARDGSRLRVTALPARHFSGRSPWNRNQTLWVSYVFRGPRHRVYCGADSGLWPGYETIGAEYGPFDLTLLEIGAFNELWKVIHLGPDGAAEALRMLGGGTLMPVHWGLFDLALHSWRQPIERMTQLAGEQGIRLFSPEPGLPTEVEPGEEIRSEWWRRGY